MSDRESGVHRLTVEDVKKCAEDLQRVPKRSEEAQEVFDTLFNYFSHMIVKCKDCMYFRGGMCVQEDIRYGYVCGDNTTTWIQSLFEPDEDFWCKFGERRELE